MREINKYISLIVLSMSFLCLNAQFTDLPYFSGFETEEERDGWIIVNTNNNNANKWVIGNAISSAGEHSLYVSGDNGKTAGYENIPSGIAVYKEFNLPADSYHFSFEWKAASNDRNDILYVCWVIDTEDKVQIESNVNGMFPISLQGDRQGNGLNGSSAWTNETFSVRMPEDGKVKVVFYWINDGADNHNPGACIDNFQIGSAINCARPSNVKFTDTQGWILDWQGNADKYEIRYKDSRGDNWVVVEDVTGNSYEFTDLKEGIWTFWIRSICGNDTSMWSIYQYYIIPSSAENCINYLNFYSPNVVATTGRADRDPYAIKQVVDKGEESMDSQHTVNYIPDRYDFNTNYGLRTIPEGEVASVRLGNWETKYGAESLTYSYTVDSVSSVLLLKYAVVLQNPGHEHENQPRFRLEVLDNKDQVIDTCAVVDFVASKNTNDWNIIGKDTDSNQIHWKDWSLFGLNLTDYMGEDIKIRLTTYDCLEGGHFGYAYFTMNCIPGELGGLTCGDNPIDSVVAPDGFYYEWYRVSDPDDIFWTERVLHITDPNDTTTYICRIISKEKENCFFELIAVIAPKFPEAYATYTLIQENCENKIQFTDRSYVYTENGVIGQQVETYYWDFGNGVTSREKNPLITYDDPGPYTVQHIVGMSNDECMDTTEYIIIIPELATVRDTIPTVICEGSYYRHENGAVFTTEGYHSMRFLQKNGCDSFVVINLSFNPSYIIPIQDTICHGETYYLNGEEYTTSGTFDQPHKTISDCDSIIRLELLVLPEITFTLNTIPVTEGNDGAILIQNATDDYTYTINGVENGPLENLSSGEYTIILIVEYENKICQSQPQTVEIARECLIVEADRLALNYCPDDNNEVVIPYIIHQGGIDKYSITFTSEGNLAGFENIESQSSNAANTFVFPIPEAATPGQYTVVVDFPGQACEVDALEIPFTIYYSAGIISQRWNDVLAVKSPLYNGGYSFSYYQWYKDNTPLSGENKSYLFEPSGLDLNSVYTVELIRMGETESVMSCGIKPEALDVDFQLQDNTATAGGSYRMTSSQNGSARIYSLTGVIISEQHFSTGINNIKAPDAQGYYILQIKFEDNTEKTFQINVGN